MGVRIPMGIPVDVGMGIEIQSPSAAKTIAQLSY